MVGGVQRMGFMQGAVLPIFAGMQAEIDWPFSWMLEKRFKSGG